MKDLLQTTNFYQDIVDSNMPIPEIFQVLSVIGVDEEFDMLYEKFHQKLETEFGTVKYEVTSEGHKEKYDMPNHQLKRVGIATAILTILAAGGVFDDELYENVVDHVENRFHLPKGTESDEDKN